MMPASPIHCPPNSTRSSRAGRAGFTLVEILMAIAISVLILGAAAIFMYSAFTMLESAQTDPGLEHHKLGVTSFLQYSFSTALPDSAIPVNPTAAGNTTAGGTAGNTTAGGSGNTGANGTLGSTTVGSGSSASTTPTSTGITGTSGLSSGIGNTTTSRAGTNMAPTVNSQDSAASSLAGNTTSPTSTSSNSTSGNSSAGNTTSGATENSTGGTNAAAAIQKTTLVAWGWPPTVSVGEDPYLTWVLPSDSPLLVWDNGPRPPIRCFLEFKDHEGLELIWVPPATPNNIEINAVRRTLLSPLVVRMTYMNYDAQGLKWNYSDTPPKDPTSGSYILPDFIQLTFDLNGKLSTMNVPIPPADTSVPLY